MRAIAKLLDWFNDWFCSDIGTIQTVVLCLIIVVIELIFPHLDPHAFLLMAVLTVYSAITQPALARAGRLAAAKAADEEAQQEKILAHITQMLDRVETLHSALHPEGDGQVVVRHIKGGGNVLELESDG